MPVMPIYWGTHNAQERLTVKESFKYNVLDRPDQGGRHRPEHVRRHHRRSAAGFGILDPRTRTQGVTRRPHSPSAMMPGRIVAEPAVVSPCRFGSRTSGTEPPGAGTFATGRPWSRARSSCSSSSCTPRAHDSCRAPRRGRLCGCTQTPSWDHPLGTDKFGRDLFTAHRVGGRTPDRLRSDACLSSRSAWSTALLPASSAARSTFGLMRLLARALQVACASRSSLLHIIGDKQHVDDDDRPCDRELVHDRSSAPRS